MLVFFCSAFLRIYLVSTFSLAFMINSFPLLTTVKNIAVTQELYHNLRPRTTQPKRRCFNLSKFIVKPFLPPGLNKTSLAPGLYFFYLFFLIRLKLPSVYLLGFAQEQKSCLRVSDHNLTQSKLLSASNMASFTRFAEYQSALFMSHILSYAKRKSSFPPAFSFSPVYPTQYVALFNSFFVNFFSKLHHVSQSVIFS